MYCWNKRLSAGLQKPSTRATFDSGHVNRSGLCFRVAFSIVLGFPAKKGSEQVQSNRVDSGINQELHRVIVLAADPRAFVRRQARCPDELPAREGIEG